MEKRIEKEWNIFKEHVIPKTADERQVDAMRTAFYGGCISLFHLVLNILEPGTEATEKDLDVMTELQKEMFEFRDEVMARKETNDNQADAKTTAAE